MRLRKWLHQRFEPDWKAEARRQIAAQDFQFFAAEVRAASTPDEVQAAADRYDKRRNVIGCPPPHVRIGSGGNQTDRSGDG